MKYRGLMLAAGLLCLTGCAPADDAGQRDVTATNSGQSLREGPRWPFWPAAMRIHPLSRLVTSPGETPQTVIEARVEFLDREGHTTKGYGTVDIDLLDAGQPGASSRVHWGLDLRTLEVNAHHFDDVTRTYLFKLDANDNLPERPQLIVRFESVDGERLQAVRELRR